jgi:BA14K-like protein
LGNEPAVLQLMPRMKKLGTTITVAVLASLSALPSFAQVSPVAWYYDGRDDVRDFPTNGFFPGDFAADPVSAAIGAAGIFGSTPYRTSPSQFIDGSPSDRSDCARRYRSYHPASGTFIGYDGARHRCH